MITLTHRAGDPQRHCWDLHGAYNGAWIARFNNTPTGHRLASQAAAELSKRSVRVVTLGGSEASDAVIQGLYAWGVETVVLA